jgi:hypothetical protein
MPKRIQFQRKKGFRLPPNCVRVTRPSRFGNPFKIGDPAPFNFGTLETVRDVLDVYEDMILYNLDENPDYLEPLRGKDLACFCHPSNSCHADILLKYANRD